MAHTIANFCGYLLEICNKSPTQKVWVSYIRWKNLEVPIHAIKTNYLRSSLFTNFSNESVKIRVQKNL